MLHKSATYYLVSELAINGGDEQACSMLKPAQPVLIFSFTGSKPLGHREILGQLLWYQFKIADDSLWR